MKDKQTSAPTCSYEYTVRRGDSFYLIAHRLGIPLRDLLEANPEVNPARMMVGDVICIPAAQDAAPPQAASPRAASAEKSAGADLPSAAAVPSPASGASDASAPADSQAAPEAAAPQTWSCPLPADDAALLADPAEDLLDRPAADADTAEAAPAPRAAAPAPDPQPPAEAPRETVSADASQPAADTAADAADAQCAAQTAHAVAEGETLSDIQLAAGLNLHTLLEANPGLDPDALTPGQVLCVPRENIPCPIRPTYTLRRDDTLESAALRLNLSIGALLRANPCLAPGDFRPGVIICLPEV